MKLRTISLLSTRLLLLAILIFSVQNVHAQKKKKKGDEPKKEAPSKDAPKDIDELIKNSAKFEGLFTVFQDSTNGDIKLLIKEDQIGKEFIYFSQIADGVVEVRGFRGNYKGAKIFKIERYFNRIEFVTQNTSSYFDPENALSRAAEANMPNAIMASLKIEGINKDKNEFLIDANALFLNETFTQIKPARHPKQPPTAFTIGNLDKDKTKINAIRSYPANTDLAIEYVYSAPSVLNGGSRAVTDARNVSIKVFHSLIEVPKNDFKPLIDDPRVGYFTHQVTDMTDPSSTNYRDLVHRWNLVKKDPNAKISEPVEPIVWWMENTTPENLRPIIKEAAEKWNIAFEKAGFKNALVVKQQPDDADWDAGDIRYNVLRWTASPFPPFGGYGPSFVNPRTGEIIGADIMFEYRSTLRHPTLEDFYNTADKQSSDDEYQMTNCSYEGCQASHMGLMNNAFAGLVVDYIDGVAIEDSKMVKEFLHYLVLHELGHTLGLNHNMKSSQLHGLNEIHDLELTQKEGLIGSVMDYPSVNASRDRTKQGLYYTMRPGPYDLWAVQFAYENGRSEEETKKLLDRSTEHDLWFGNDADDMRSPGKAIDPRVNIGDLTSDAIEYATERMELTKDISTKILEKYNTPNTSHHDQLVAYFLMLRQYRDAASTMSRYIGGVYVDRAMKGQPGATDPYTPVEIAKQKLAMNTISSYLLAPNSFDFCEDLYNQIAPQRRGFNFFMGTEDPKIHIQVLSIQSSAIDHILHPTTMQRITDTELYGNEYGLSDVMSDLTNAVFKSDISGNVNSFRQNLQIAYTNKLIGMITGVQSKRYTNISKSHAIYFLNQIRKMATNNSGDISTKAHKTHLNTLIDNALKEVK